VENIDLLVLWGHMESRLWRLVEAAGEHPKSSILQRINDKLRISVEVSVCGRHQIHRNPWRLEYRQGCSGRSRAQRHADSGGRRASAQSGHRHSCVGEINIPAEVTEATSCSEVNCPQCVSSLSKAQVSEYPKRDDSNSILFPFGEKCGRPLPSSPK